MKIGVLGTEGVGRALAGKLAALGHEVKVGTRDPAATLARKETSQMGVGPFAAWLAEQKNVTLGTFADAVAHGEVVVNALNGHASLAVAPSIAAAAAGKVFVDVSNPLDFSKGFPPSLFVSNTDSLGEQLQKLMPAAKVVKTLNTCSAPTMVSPASLGGGDHTMFVCGNDDGAKAKVTSLLKEGFGWKDVVDLGDVTASRGTEALVLAWVRAFAKFQTPNVAFKLVR